jgi:hypothetical protein
MLVTLGRRPACLGGCGGQDAYLNSVALQRMASLVVGLATLGPAIRQELAAFATIGRLGQPRSRVMHEGQLSHWLSSRPRRTVEGYVAPEAGRGTGELEPFPASPRPRTATSAFASLRLSFPRVPGSLSPVIVSSGEKSYGRVDPVPSSSDVPGCSPARRTTSRPCS